MSEVVPPYLRGALVNVHAISLVFGYFVQGWIGYAFYFWEDGGVSNTWRVPIVFQCVWPLALLIGLYWVPESPRWLILKGREDEARDILMRLHDDGVDENHTFARAEYIQIQKQLALDRTLESGWLHIFRKPSLRKRTWITLATTGFVQCSGVLVINNYGPTLYRQLGFGVERQLLYPAAWLTLALGLNGMHQKLADPHELNVADVLSTAMASLMVDHFPRNTFLSIGVAGCMVTLIIHAALVAQFGDTQNEPALQAAVAMLFIFEIPYDWCLDGMQIPRLCRRCPLSNSFV